MIYVFCFYGLFHQLLFLFCVRVLRVLYFILVIFLGQIIGTVLLQSGHSVLCENWCI